jgi:hypothetical protein
VQVILCKRIDRENVCMVSQGKPGRREKSGYLVRGKYSNRPYA